MTRPPRLGLSVHLWLPVAGLTLATGLCPIPARGDVDARRLFETLARDLPARQPARALGLSSDDFGVTAELPRGVRAEDRGLVPIAGPYAGARGSGQRLSALMANNPDVRFRWSPPLRPQLDAIESWSGAGKARADTGLTGAGVVVGVIDTGVDTKHPALRHENGATRVRWLIDFGQEPRGRHPELEATYGCTEDSPCAVLSSDDINELLENEIVGDEATDLSGHGTHVASIAAGNGAPEGQYIGVAPEADLIVAQVGTGASGAIFDVNILTAARFIFERAEELGQPAVLNVSLGSNFGAHDGSSALEVGLASLLGGPGRAIVTAAGNSAGQYRGLSDAYPGPFGIHTEVHVASAGTTRVPILTPALTSRPTSGAVFVWIASSPGDDLRVGFATGQGGGIPPIRRGRSAAYGSEQLGDSDEYVVAIVNGTEESSLGVPVDANSAVVIIVGEWRAGRTFALRLEGQGSARIWLEGSGDVDPNVSLGALLPASFKAGTVAIPASHPGLIAVGATINRTSWTDHTGASVQRPQHGALEEATHDTTAFFSAAGPTNSGVLKPDLVAPGVNIIAAMSREADPRISTNYSSQFDARGQCAPGGGQCLVVTDDYALATGTSMAAPAVTGAVALLLQREPTLTQERVLALLQAGSRPLEGTVFAPEQAGAGALDVVGSLQAQDGGPPTPPTQARVALAQGFVYPDPEVPLQGLVMLRDAQGQPASGFEPQRLTASAPGASSLELSPVTDGLWRLVLAFPRGSAGARTELTISFDGAVLVRQSLPVAVDPHTAEWGSRARGGCTMGPGPSGVPSWLTFLAMVFGVRFAARRRAHTGGTMCFLGGRGFR